MAQSFHAGRNDALLTDAESEELAALTAEGRHHQAGLWLVLKRIHDKALYREFGTWEAYCLEEWEIGRQRAYEIIRAAAVVANLECTQLRTPANEAQTRPLTTLKTPEAQREVWQEAVATATDGKVTGKHVAAVVSRLYPKASAAEEVTFTDTAAAEEGDAIEEEEDAFNLKVSYRALLGSLNGALLMGGEDLIKRCSPAEVHRVWKGELTKASRESERKELRRLAVWLLEFTEQGA